MTPVITVFKPRPAFSHDQIARCAYDIHIEHGRRDDRSEQDWLQAEEELAQKATAVAHKADVDRQA